LVGFDCAAPVFGLTKAVDVPVILYDNVYKVIYTVTAVNNAQTDLNQVSLNEDLAKTFPAPASFSLLSLPYITSHASGLVLDAGFDGVNQVNLTNSVTSVLYAGKRDTIVFELAVDPHGFSGPYLNWIIGSANYLNLVFKTDSSNNGFIWDQNGNGSPLDDNAPTIVDLPILDPFIPEVITPNGDGRNDRFVIKYLNERNATISIFNRWGNKVYEKENYDNSWDGYPNVNSPTIGHGLLPQATYFYIIQFADGKKETYRGYVVVQY
jgi:gliding motility-associated-like protein